MAKQALKQFVKLQVNQDRSKCFDEMNQEMSQKINDNLLRKVPCHQKGGLADATLYFFIFQISHCTVCLK